MTDSPTQGVPGFQHQRFGPARKHIFPPFPWGNWPPSLPIAGKTGLGTGGANWVHHMAWGAHRAKLKGGRGPRVRPLGPGLRPRGGNSPRYKRGGNNTGEQNWPGDIGLQTKGGGTSRHGVYLGTPPQRGGYFTTHRGGGPWWERRKGALKGKHTVHRGHSEEPENRLKATGEHLNAGPGKHKQGGAPTQDGQHETRGSGFNPQCGGG